MERSPLLEACRASKVAAERVWMEHRFTMMQVFQEEAAGRFGVNVYKIINEDRGGIEDYEDSD